MKTNPGGQIEVNAAIGRDKLVQFLWDTIKQQSLLMTAERRIGKTTVMKMMQRHPVDGWLAIYQDLERCHSAMEFAMLVYQEIHRFLSGKEKFARRSKELLSALGGIEIGGFLKLPEKTTAPWKDVLTRAIEDLIHENDSGTKLLFLWDELPFMIMNIRDSEGEQTAMQVLDHLRWLRQTHEGLRMVITGSIGLHHVVSSLKEKNYANSPVNDLVSVEVPPLSKEDAAFLATQLIAGENLKSIDIEATSSTIANEADCFAFYIHHIVRGLKIQDMTATPANVTQIVRSHLTDSNDPWQLIHYRERIATYYPNDQKTVCLLLDELALASEPLPLNDLLKMLKGASTFDDRERLVRLLSFMERDHYLKRDEQGHYQFRFPLIRRWWRLVRDL